MTLTETQKKTTFRESVSKILVKWGMGTKQVAILEIVREHESLIALVKKETREQTALEIEKILVNERNDSIGVVKVLRKIKELAPLEALTPKEHITPISKNSETLSKKKGKL